MSNEFDIVNEDVFDFDYPEQVVAVVWWLVHLLGDRVVIPTGKDFWLDNFPDNTRLVMRPENGQLVLVSEVEN